MKALIKNKKIFIVLGLVLLLFAAVPHLVEAQTSNILTSVGAGVVTFALKIVVYFVNVFLGFVFSLASELVNIATSLNAQILDKSNTLVEIGWTITRDVANLGFVLVMIVIAVATIIRYEKYAVQKLLPMLIGAAILVNFSLTIAGVLLNFSDTVASAFSSRLNSGNITDSLAEAFSPQRLLLKDTDNPQPPDPANQGGLFTDFSAAVLIDISGLLFSVVFLAIADLSMVTLALMLLYRYLFISFLLVLAPLAWLFWVFPATSDLFSKWWKNFLKWAFFLPATTFFLYLAVETALALKNSPIITQGGIFTTTGFASILAQGAQMIILAGLLLGGLIVAQSMGIAGASGAMKLADKAKGGVLNYSKNVAGRAVSRPLRGEWGKKATDWMQTAGQNSALGRFVGAPLRGIGRGAAKIRLDQEKKTADAAKKLPKDLQEQARQFSTSSTPRRVAIAANLIKERNARNKKKAVVDQKLSSAKNKLTDLENQESEELKVAGMDIGKRNEIKARFAETKRAAQNAVNDAEGEVREITKPMEEIDRVLATLPKNIQKELADSATARGGRMDMKDVKIGRLYGYRESVVMPGQSSADIVLEAAKKAAEEAEGGSIPKKEVSEPKSSKTTT